MEGCFSAQPQKRGYEDMKNESNFFLLDLQHLLCPRCGGGSQGFILNAAGNIQAEVESYVLLP